MPADGLRSPARFPDVASAAGHYESFYIKTSDPAEPLGVWIRHTVHKPSGKDPVGSLWFTLFDGSGDGPRASKVTLPPGELGSGPDHYIHVGESRLEPGRASGGAKSELVDASWELEFESPEPPLRHLPRDWMYRARLPRTKLLSPYPGARFSGRVQVDGRTLELDGWPGMIGHNWGAEHAERWIWMHGTGFDGHGPDTWLDMALGRIKVGPATTPWIGNGCLSLGGDRIQLGGLERMRSTEVGETPIGCEFELAGKGVKLRGTVGSDRESFVGWVYADPDGGEHHTVNCSVARMELTVERRGEEPLTLVTRGGAAYELGMRERDHGMQIQPFPDP